MAEDEAVKSNKDNRRRFSFKEWLALAVSLVALTISGTSAYYTVVQRSQVLDAFPLLTPQLRQIGSTLFPKGPIKLMFVNKGNLPIAVSSAEVFFSECEDIEDERCGRYDEQFTARRDARLDPFVIQAGEILIKDLLFDEGPFEFQEIKLEPDEESFIYGQVEIDLVTDRGLDGGPVFLGQWPYVTSKTSETDKNEMLNRDDHWPVNITHWPFHIVDDRWSIFGGH